MHRKRSRFPCFGEASMTIFNIVRFLIFISPQITVPQALVLVFCKAFLRAIFRISVQIFVIL